MNFRIFERLCGDDFSNIVLTTTMWDEVSESEGAAREDELIRDYWRPMMERGSYVRRFHYSQESALSILAPFFREVHKRSALLLQKELSDLRLQLNDTSAGKVLYLELGELVSRHEDVLGKIRSDLKDMTIGPDQLPLLMEDYRNVSAQLRRATEDMRKMDSKITTKDRIYNFITLAWIRRLPKIQRLVGDVFLPFAVNFIVIFSYFLSIMDVAITQKRLEGTVRGGKKAMGEREGANGGKGKAETGAESTSGEGERKDGTGGEILRGEERGTLGNNVTGDEGDKGEGHAGQGTFCDQGLRLGDDDCLWEAPRQSKQPMRSMRTE